MIIFSSYKVIKTPDKYYWLYPGNFVHATSKFRRVLLFLPIDI